MPSIHAKLSPSGSKLDLHCPGNRNEQAKHPDNRNESADKGTGAHGLGERCLVRGDDTRRYLNWWCGCNADGADFLTEAKPSASEIAAGVAAFLVDAKMAADVQMHVDFIRGLVNSTPGSTMGVEVPSRIDENIWGTTDGEVAQPYGTLHIVDYKNGVTYVDAFQCSQLMLYAVGRLLMYQAQGIEFTGVIMTIVQPNAREGAPIRSYPEQGVIAPAELFNWFNTVYFPAAKRCLDPNAPLIPGTWCKTEWCDARHDCPALLQHNNEVVSGMFAPVAAQPRSLPPAMSMTPQQRAKILENKALMVDWLNQIEAHEYKLHMQGQGSWGKLVKGQNARKWANKNTIEANLSIMLGPECYNPGALKSPAQVEATLMERGFTKAAAYAKIKDMISVIPGKPRLVAADAPGTTHNPVNAMFTAH